MRVVVRWHEIRASRPTGRYRGDLAGAVTVTSGATRVVAWLTEPVPLGRIAAFRTAVYLFVIGDLVLFTAWIRAHGDLPGEAYRPLLVGRVLPLPTPTPTVVDLVFWALLVAAWTARPQPARPQPTDRRTSRPAFACHSCVGARVRPVNTCHSRSWHGLRELLQ